jgi:DNA-binding transcriptional LysR family regulator
VESRQLRYFVAVAREKNFTRAAEKLHIAQPPLSRQIQALEDEFGAELFDRNSRPLALTEAGKILYDQSMQVLERMDEMKAAVKRLIEADKPRYSIGFVASTLYGYLPEVIRRYRAARPGTEILLHEMTTVEQLVALKEGRIDVGFGRLTLQDPAVDRVLLRNESICAALPLEHPLAARRDSLALEEFAQDTLIVYPRAPRPSYADQVLSIFRDRNITPRAVLEVRELQTALGLVAANSGVALVPGSVERLRRDNVVYRALSAPEAVSPVMMSTRKGDRSPEVERMLKIIKDMYRKDGVAFGK